MSSIDKRVVEMEFNQGKFQSGVSSTLSALDKLKAALKFDGAKKGLADLEGASKGVKLSGIAQAVEDIKGKFSAMSVVGIAALATLAAKAVSYGGQIAQGMIKPMTEGFAEYELKMGSIQTILANTQRHGTNLKDVSGALDELNQYADKTIYNFGDMTRNIGLFTNSGMKLEDATSAIKGFSNAAAASGTSSQGAAGAAYQLSQAMSAGTIRLMDWRSLTNVGMGGKNMQEGLINIGQAMGQFNDDTTTAIAAGKDFNGSLESQWLSADVMSTYLNVMAQDTYELAYAQAKAAGLGDKQAKSLAKQAVTANEAATKVRTFTQLMGTLAEASASGWTETFELLLGDFDEATELFTNISEAVGGLLDRQADARNKTLSAWKEAGGRDDLVAGFTNIFNALGDIIKPIQKAFREIFPPATGETLIKITRGFRELTENFKMGEAASKFLYVAFKVLFTSIKIVLDILLNLARGVLTVVGVFIGLGAGVAAFAGFLIVAAAKFAAWLVQTEEAQRIFSALRDLWDDALGTIKNLGDRLTSFGRIALAAFQSLQDGFRADAIRLFSRALTTLGVSQEKAMGYARDLVGWLTRLRSSAQSVAENFRTNALAGFATALEKVASWARVVRDALSFDFSINTGKLKASGKDMEGLKRVWQGFLDLLLLTGGILANALGDIGSFIGKMLGKIGDYIVGLDFQELLALINTGFFIAFYATMTSFLKNIQGLTEGFSGIGAGIKDTLGSISEALDGFGKETTADKILKIGIALGILAASAWVLSTIDTANLVKALVAIAVMMAQLTITLKIMSKLEFGEDTKMLKIAAMLILMAIAINILASAVRKFEGLSWQDLAKGLIGVSVLLAGLALFSKFAEVDKGGIKSSVGLILLAAAIHLLASAVERFGTMDPGVLKQGLITLGLLLAGLAAMSKVLSGTSGLIQAAVGLLVLSAALVALSFAVRYFATLDWETMVDGLQKMAAVLIAVGVASRFLPADLPVKAIGLILVAGALVILSGALALIGNLPIDVVVQGLTAIAIALGIVAIAMNLMANPGVLAGAAAMLVVVAALYLFVPILVALGSLPFDVIATGLIAIALTFAVFALGGVALTAVMPTLLLFGAFLIILAAAVALAGVAVALFAVGFAIFVAAFVAGSMMVLTFLQQVGMMLPLFAQQVGLAIVAFAVVIRDSAPVLAGAIGTVLIAILLEIQRITPVLLATFRGMVLGWLESARILLPQVARTFMDMFLQFMTIAATYVPQIVAKALEMMNSILAEVALYVPQIVEKAMQLMRDFLAAVADNIGPIVDEATRLMIEFMEGIERNIPQLVQTGVRMVKTFIREVGSALLGGVPDLIGKGKELASGIVSGIASGIRNAAGTIKDAAVGAAKSAFDAAKRFLNINSPSRKFMWIGEMSDKGFAKGLDDYAGLVGKSSQGVGMEAINAMKKSVALIPDVMNDLGEVNPVITPVLDLSDIRKNAPKLSRLFEHTPPINVDTARADTLANQMRASGDAATPGAGTTVVKEYKFEQTNNSPIPLPAGEIYRNTKTLLSLAKELPRD